MSLPRGAGGRSVRRAPSRGESAGRGPPSPHSPCSAQELEPPRRGDHCLPRCALLPPRAPCEAGVGAGWGSLHSRKVRGQTRCGAGSRVRLRVSPANARYVGASPNFPVLALVTFLNLRTDGGLEARAPPFNDRPSARPPQGALCLPRAAEMLAALPAPEEAECANGHTQGRGARPGAEARL